MLGFPVLHCLQEFAQTHVHQGDDAIQPSPPLLPSSPPASNLDGLSFPPPGDLPHPGIKHVSLMSPALAGRFLTSSTIWEALTHLVETMLILVGNN